MAKKLPHVLILDSFAAAARSLTSGMEKSMKDGLIDGPDVLLRRSIEMYDAVVLVRRMKLSRRQRTYAGKRIEEIATCYFPIADRYRAQSEAPEIGNHYTRAWFRYLKQRVTTA